MVERSIEAIYTEAYCRDGCACRTPHRSPHGEMLIEGGSILSDGHRLLVMGFSRMLRSSQNFNLELHL